MMSSIRQISLPQKLLPSPSLIFFLVASMTLLVCPAYQHQMQDADFSSYEMNGEIHNSHHTSATDKTDEKLREMGQPKQRPKNLTCHVCYSDKNADCMQFPKFPEHLHRSEEEDEENEEEEEEEDDEDRDRRLIKDRMRNAFAGFPSQCHNESYVCSVRKFAFAISNGTGHGPMKTFALKRNCTMVGQCQPGCVIMGERTRIYVCTTCCTSNLCNIGNGAEQIQFSVLPFLALLSAQWNYW